MTRNPSSRSITESMLNQRQSERAINSKTGVREHHYVRHRVRGATEKCLPCPTSSVEDEVAVAGFQQLHQKVPVDVRPVCPAADVVFPDFGRLAVGVLVGYALGGYPERPGSVHTVDHADADKLLQQILYQALKINHELQTD